MIGFGMGRSHRWTLTVGTLALFLAGCGDDNEAEGGADSGGGTSGVATGASFTTTAGSGSSNTPTGPGGSSGPATTGSTGPDLPEIDCETTVESDLPGVTTDVTSDCAVSIGQAQSGVLTQYAVLISEAVTGVDSGYSCIGTPKGGVAVSWSIVGPEQQSHCRCDVGFCGPHQPAPTDLAPSEVAGEFEWFGFEWSGPSDFGAPFGPAFPPGSYTIRVVATGFHTDAAGTEIPFTITATRPVVLVE